MNSLLFYSLNYQSLSLSITHALFFSRLTLSLFISLSLTHKHTPTHTNTHQHTHRHTDTQTHRHTQRYSLFCNKLYFPFYFFYEKQQQQQQQQRQQQEQNNSSFWLSAIFSPSKTLDILIRLKRLCKSKSEGEG